MFRTLKHSIGEDTATQNGYRLSLAEKRLLLSYHGRTNHKVKNLNYGVG